MAGGSLLPFFSRNWPMSRSGDDADPFTALRRQMNRLFDDTSKAPAPRWREFVGSANSTIGRVPLCLRGHRRIPGFIQEDLPQHHGIVVRLIMRSEHQGDRAFTC
jgi:hypothetical protein